MKENHLHFDIEGIRNELAKMRGPKFYSIHQTCDILKISEWTLRRLIKEGTLDATRIRGSWRIPASAILDYAEEENEEYRNTKSRAGCRQIS